MIDAIRARLASKVAALKTVRTTADLGSVVDGGARHALPGAWVHPVRDAAGPNRLVNATDQQLTRTVGILLVVSATGADRGAGVPDTLAPLLAATRAALLGWPPATAHDPLLAATRAALLGWPPATAHDPLLHAGGDMVRVAGGTAMWLERWTTTTHLRSV